MSGTISSSSMIFRFSLYGLLKNQRCFEPFLILVFLEKGLSFFEIGLLVAFREVAINLFEIPSGAVADLWGRRRAMIVSFCAYIGSFVVFAQASDLVLLFAAMFLFAVGEAFRSGTHKAMIFTWLRLQGRTKERTRVYGYTRSWSKYGSAASVILAAVVVYVSESYQYVFYLSVIPYFLGVINFLGYPAQLDGAGSGGTSFDEMRRHLSTSFREVFSSRALRRLVAESVGFQGMYEVIKDYLQPVLRTAAIAAGGYWVATETLSEIQQTALLVGPVYLILYLVAGVASRKSHLIATRAGDEDRAARMLWGVYSVLFIMLCVAAFHQAVIAMILAFVLLDTFQNLWRPVQLARIDVHGKEEQGATLLSIESQAKRGAAIIFAPVLGLAVDMVTAYGPGGSYWPVGLVGALVTFGFFLTAPGRRPRSVLDPVRQASSGGQ